MDIFKKLDFFSPKKYFETDDYIFNLIENKKYNLFNI